jgi:hypothetical protein
MDHFHAFGVNRGNIFLYLLQVSCYFLNKRNFFPYFMGLLYEGNR